MQAAVQAAHLGISLYKHSPGYRFLAPIGPLFSLARQTPGAKRGVAGCATLRAGAEREGKSESGWRWFGSTPHLRHRFRLPRRLELR